MAVRLEVEAVFKITDRGYFVFAKSLEKEKNFWVTENSKLGNVEITKTLDQPRALEENGEPRLDLYAFQLKNESDSHHFKEGEIIELIPGDELIFYPPWTKIESGDFLENEIKKELSKNHILFGKELKPIAKREDNDDVLFKIGQQEMAVVHLTWSGKNEGNSEFPKTSIFPHWTDVYEKVISIDAKDYEI